MNRIAGRLALVLAATVALAAAPPRARAEEGDDDAAAEGRVSVAVFLIPEGKVPRGALSLLARSIEQSLKKNPKITLKDHDLLLAEFAGEVPSDAVSEARGLVTAGKELLGQGRSKEAAVRLRAAEGALENVLAFIKKKELADAQFLLGVALARAGEKKDALSAFVRLRIWRPSYVLDVEKYSEVLPLWQQAEEDVGKRPRGSLEVLSEPDGALAFVDGKFLGVTPVTAEGLVVGEHYVTLTLDGYQRRLVKAKVDAQYQELVTESLPRSEKVLLVEQSLARAKPALGQNVADQSMLDLRSFLFIDQAVFVKVSPKNKDLAVEAFLYDLRSKRRLSRVSVTVPTPYKKQAEPCKKLATSLYSHVRYDGKTDEDDRLASEGRGGHKTTGGGKHFYQRWWFWTAVGVAAAGVATPFIYKGVTAGANVPDCPPGDLCGEVFIQY